MHETLLPDTDATVVVYSAPSCQQCRMTYAALERAGVPYRSVDASADPAATARLRDLGYRQVPVVVTANGEHWAGFRPDRIAALTGTSGR